MNYAPKGIIKTVDRDKFKSILEPFIVWLCNLESIWKLSNLLITLTPTHNTKLSIRTAFPSPLWNGTTPSFTNIKASRSGVFLPLALLEEGSGDSVAQAESVSQPYLSLKRGIWPLSFKQLKVQFRLDD